MKSDYSKESITEFLSRKYGEDIRLFPIKEGQESQAYWFSRGGRICRAHKFKYGRLQKRQIRL